MTELACRFTKRPIYVGIVVGVLVYFFMHLNGFNEGKRRARNRTNPDPELQRFVLLGRSQPMKEVMLSIGIVYTPRQQSLNYLQQTLTGLFKVRESDEPLLRVFVLLRTFRKSLLTFLKTRFEHQLDAGMLVVVGPVPDTHYSNFNEVELTQKVLSKDTMDYAFLWRVVSLSPGRYYLHLNEQVGHVARHYLQHMFKYVDAHRMDKNWAIMQFTRGGGVALNGKLMRHGDLRKLVTMAEELSAETHPGQLLDIYSSNQKQPLLGPILFEDTSVALERFKDKQYDGKQVNDFVDDDDDDVLTEENLLKLNMKGTDADSIYGRGPWTEGYFKDKDMTADNPPVIAETTINTAFARPYPPMNAYLRKKGFFWSDKLQLGDTITFTFTVPQNINRLRVQTGDEQHRMDILWYGQLQWSDRLTEDGKCGAVNNNGITGEKDFVNGVVEIEEPVYGMRCFQILVTLLSRHWLLISDIAVHVNNKEEEEERIEEQEISMHDVQGILETNSIRKRDKVDATRKRDTLDETILKFKEDVKRRALQEQEDYIKRHTHGKDQEDYIKRHTQGKDQEDYIKRQTQGKDDTPEPLVYRNRTGKKRNVPSLAYRLLSRYYGPLDHKHRWEMEEHSMDGHETHGHEQHGNETHGNETHGNETYGNETFGITNMKEEYSVKRSSLYTPGGGRHSLYHPAGGRHGITNSVKEMSTSRPKRVERSAEDIYVSKKKRN